VREKITHRNRGTVDRKNERYTGAHSVGKRKRSTKEADLYIKNRDSFILVHGSNYAFQNTSWRV
jgi:hypothetical protein